MDKELDDLLDSALEDFKTEPNQSENSNSNVTIEKTNLYVDDIDYDDRPTNSTKQSDSKLAPQTESQADDLKLFDEIFNNEDTKKSMEKMYDMFKNLGTDQADLSSLKSDDKILENIGKMFADLTDKFKDEETDDVDDKLSMENEINSAKQLLESLQGFSKFNSDSATVPKKENMQLYEDDVDDDYKPKTSNTQKQDTKPDNQNPLFKVLENLNKNSDKILNNESNSGDFFSKLNDLNDTDDLNDDELDGASSMMMEPILSMLFSKDILYPSLKLMLENYDKYIEDRREKFTEQELKKCLDQKDCIKEMCTVYENSKETDSKEEKSVQLKKIVELLEKCGMPPNELVPEVNPFEILGDQAKQNSCPVS